MFPTWSDWNLTYTRRGLLKLGAKRLLRIMFLFAAISGIMQLQRSAKGLATDLRNLMRQALSKGAVVLSRTKAMI
jgi:hypothetical protein